MLEYLYFINAPRPEDAAVPGTVPSPVPAPDPAVAAAASPAGGASAADALAQRMGALELAVETTIRLLVQQGAFTEEQFLTLARSIDAEDGVMDGRRDLTRMKKFCGQCGKPNAANRSVCMWCGASVVDEKPVPNQL